MRKDYLFFGVIGVFALGCNYAVQKVNAADMTGVTQVNVEFTATTVPTKPLDPQDPGKELPAGGSITGNTSPLSLDYIPTSFNFGTSQMSMAKVELKTTDRNIVQVTDNRGSNGLGWILSVATTDPLSQNGVTLKNSKIKFGQASSQYTLDQKSWVTDKHVPVESPELATDQKSTSGVTIENAAVGSGLGSNQAIWDAGQITLLVDGSQAKAGKYTGQLTWTLTSAASI